MSKMSQLHATLDEQAVELGFKGLGEALIKGYDVDYENRTLIRKTDAQEEAHADWLKRKEEILKDLEMSKNNINTIIDRAIDFIKEGEV